MPRFRLATGALLAATLLLSTGCSHFVAQQITGRGSRPDAAAGVRSAFPEVFRHPGVQRERLLASDGTPLAYLRLSSASPPPALQCERTSPFSFQVTLAGAGREEQATPPDRGSVLLLHAHGGFKESMLVLGTVLARHGYTVLVPDARGHGESGGTVALGMRDAQDLAELLDHEAAQGRLPAPLAVIGLSMGAVSAARLSAADPRVQALVLIGPQPPLPQATTAAARLVNPLGAWLVGDAALAEGARLAARQLGIADADELSAEWGWQRNRDRPLLVIHGADDGVSPPDFNRQLAGHWSPPAERLLLAARGHRQLHCQDDELLQPLIAWLERVPASAAITTSGASRLR